MVRGIGSTEHGKILQLQGPVSLRVKQKSNTFQRAISDP